MDKLFVIISILFSYILAEDDYLLREIETIKAKKAKEIKFFFDAKGYLSLKSIALAPNELLNYSKEYISLKEVPIEKKEQFDPKKYLALKRIIYPMPQNYAKAYLNLKRVEDELKVVIDKSIQRMFVYLNDELLYSFRVSTARRGYWTPNGVFKPYSLERMHYSRKYHNSPMPWSVFFKGGYAIHGTYSIGRLGHPASHGCVRVHPKNAKKIYHLIKKVGKKNTKIIIKG